MVTKGLWLGKPTRVVIASRMNEELVIPEWCLAPESRYLLEECADQSDEEDPQEGGKR